MNYSEKYGNSIDEAVALALMDLKVSKDDVNVTVLEEPSKGFLGLGSKLAKVRVEIKPEILEEKKNKEEKKEAQEVKPAVVHGQEDRSVQTGAAEESGESEKPRENRSRKRKGRKPRNAQPKRDYDTASVRPADLQPVDEHEAIDFLKDTTEKMGLHLSFKAEMNDENIYIDISGKDTGTIIGKRGQTLDAIQYLTSLVINKNRDSYMRVVLDAENYRHKRKKTLENLADRLAGKVARTGKRVRLEPMNPYERMIIHAKLQNDERVITRSEGEEPYRRVIIELK